jgi:hypothetical protein
MQINKMLNKPQPEPKPGNTPATLRINLPKPLEDTSQSIWLNPTPGIPHHQLNLLTFNGHANLDFTLRTELHSIR